MEEGRGEQGRGDSLAECLPLWQTGRCAPHQSSTSTRNLEPGNSLLWTFIYLLGHTTLESGYRALLVRIFVHRVQSSGNVFSYLTI